MRKTSLLLLSWVYIAAALVCHKLTKNKTRQFLLVATLTSPIVCLVFVDDTTNVSTNVSNIIIVQAAEECINLDTRRRKSTTKNHKITFFLVISLFSCHMKMKIKRRKLRGGKAAKRKMSKLPRLLECWHEKYQNSTSSCFSFSLSCRHNRRRPST